MSKTIKTSLIIVFLTVILSSLDILYYQRDVIRYLIELKWLIPMGLLSGSIYLFWTRIIVPFIDDYLPSKPSMKNSISIDPNDFDVRKVFEGTLDDGREIEIFFKHNQIGDFWVEEVIKNDEPLVKIGIKETGRLLYLKTEKPDLELYQRVKDHLGMIVFDSPDVVGDLSVFIKKLGHEVQLMNSTTV